MIVLSEIFLYVCFSVVMGTFLLGVIPEHKRPAIHVPKPLLISSIIGIPVLSFFPVLEVMLFFEDINFGLAFQSVVFSFDIGQAWLVTTGVSFLLLVSTLLPLSAKVKAIAGVEYTFILILALGWAGHAASLSIWGGFVAHSAHFLAVSVWVGALLVAGWFSTNTANWRSFLNWYHPLAVACVLIALAAGLVLMLYVVTFQDYTTSWALPYGQALFSKHLLIIPLLTYALLNGVLMKRRLKQDPDYNPKPWVKAESVVVFLIFVVTAVMGDNAPPHNIATTMRYEGPSWLFSLFYSGSVEPGIVVNLQFGLLSIALLALAVVFLGLLVYSFIKKAPAIFSIVMSLLFVVASYLGLMSAV